MTTRQRRRRESRRKQHSETSPTRRRLIAAGGLTAGATLAIAGSAQAAPMTFTVGTNADDSTGGACTTPANTDCSLREAISQANGNAGADTIVFNSNLSGSTISLTTGELAITEAVTIDGDTQDVTLDGGGSQRIFNVNPGTPGDQVSIYSLTLTGGTAATGNGGAISNDDAYLHLSGLTISDSDATDTTSVGRGGGVFTNTGKLVIDQSTLSGNHAYFGGGVGSLHGPVYLNDSTVSGNHADGRGPATNYAEGYGGGINTYAADLTVTRSTIDHNVGGHDGGGIYSAYSSAGPGSLTIQNSTIADNQALNDDGGGVWICCDGTLEAGETFTIVNSTVTGNTAASAAGGLQSYVYTVSPVLENSVVSGNISGSAPSTDDLRAEVGYQWDASFDLIGVPTIAFINDIVGNVLGGNPRLGPLADNGGATMTMAPQCGSDAIDQGKAFSLTADQRDETRPVGLPDYPDSTATGHDGSDIGAVELQSTPGTACASPTAKAFGSRSVDAGPSATQTVMLTNAGASALNVSTVELVGANPGEFTKSNDTCAGASVAAGASCTVGVAFDPSSAGAKSALLRFTDDSLVTTQDVLLTGTGVAVPPTPVTPTPAPTHKKKCKKKKHKRSADSAKMKKCKKKK
jgi:CSLREA domain-containing protein